MIERVMSRSAALVATAAVAALPVLGVATVPAAAAPTQHGAVLAADTDPSDPYGWCRITKACWE